MHPVAEVIDRTPGSVLVLVRNNWGDGCYDS